MLSTSHKHNISKTLQTKTKMFLTYSCVVEFKKLEIGKVVVFFSLNLSLCTFVLDDFLVFLFELFFVLDLRLWRSQTFNDKTIQDLIKSNQSHNQLFGT